MKEAAKELQRRLGLKLKDEKTLRQALTHKSWVNEHRDQDIGDNERLEFLGDAVLDLAISHRLMERLPDAPEGTLSKLRASLVDEANLSQVASEVGLGELLYLGKGEEASGGRKKASLLANALEAVLAVVYVERGIEGTLEVVDKLFRSGLEGAVAGAADRDYKTQLQERTRKLGLAPPKYRVVEERGPSHRKVFVVEVVVDGKTFVGEGHAKKIAEQLGANKALEALD